MEDDTILNDDVKLAETFNNYFKNAVSNLEIDKNSEYEETPEDNFDPIEVAVLKFRNHPSVKRIKEVVGLIGMEQEFNFKNVSTSDLENKITKLNTRKATTYKNIPSQILKNNTEVCSPYFMSILNYSFENDVFPENLKKAEVLPVFKSGDSTLKTNFRPVSVLPTISKVFERVMQDQIVGYIDKYLSKYLCGFRKGYSTQEALILLLEK